ncbi:MAG: helix-turn-helix transcriptional regulator [Hyphomicrobiales bacterium]|nr:helix-turn-helix transcriptional regulator [Hyphomicrobiales bacterium]
MATRARSISGKERGAKAVGAWGARENGILEVAHELFMRDGYENTSMAAVAAAAGLSEGTLYNYFQNKTDLVIRASLAALEIRVAAAKRAVEEARTLREGLERLIALHLSAIIEDEEKYRIWLREVRGVKSYRRSAGRDALGRFANQFPALLAKFGLDRDPPDGPSRAMMRDMIFGGSEHIGFTAMIQRRADGIDVGKTARQLADVYLRGFGLG